MTTLKQALCASVAALTLMLHTSAPAQEYPNRPIRLISPYAAGGLTDILARSLAQELSARVGQPVVVENRAGGGGVIGIDFAAKAPPDGYTLAIAGQGLASVNASLYPSLPYNTQRDFKPLSLIAKFSLVLVGNAQRPPESVKQLVDLAKQKPDALSYGSAGNASTAHLTMEMFKDSSGTNQLHIPFKGESAAFTELVGGRIDTMFATVGGALPLIQGGKLRALAVADKTRSPLLPQVPTLQEAGINNFEVFGWYVVLAPANVPSAVADRLSKALMEIGRSPEFRKAMADRGMEAVGSSPEDAAKTVQSETTRWAALVKKARITVD